MYKNSYFTKKELLLTPNIKDEDETIINMKFNNFLHVANIVKLKNLMMPNYYKIYR